MKKKIAQFLRRIASVIDPEVILAGEAHTEKGDQFPQIRPYATFNIEKAQAVWTFPSSPQQSEIEKRHVATIKETLARNIGETLYKEGFITFAEDNEPIPFGRDLLVATVFVARKQINDNPKY